MHVPNKMLAVIIGATLFASSVEGFTPPPGISNNISNQRQLQSRRIGLVDANNNVQKGMGRDNNKGSAVFLSSVGADEFLMLGGPTKVSENEDGSRKELASAATTSIPAAESITFGENVNESTSIEELVTPTTREFTPFQQVIRALPILTTAAYLYDPMPLDNLVASIYSTIYNWDFAQLPLFEAEVAVFGFFASIVLFSSLHLVLGEERTKASRFDGELPHQPFEWAQPQNFHLWFNPTASYLGSIWFYLTFLHDKPPLPEMPPTFGVLTIETLFGVFMYDLCFMPIHYLMHNLNIGQVRRVHGYHHRSTSTLNALETVQHSYLDGFLQVFVNILVQQISPFGGPKHVMSRLAHNLIVTYLLSEAHSGYRDVPWMSHNLFPEILGGAPRHEAHHHNGRVYYQQYFKYIDDFFGFVEHTEGDEYGECKE